MYAAIFVAVEKYLYYLRELLAYAFGVAQKTLRSFVQIKSAYSFAPVRFVIFGSGAILCQIGFCTPILLCFICRGECMNRVHAHISFADARVRE